MTRRMTADEKAAKAASKAAKTSPAADVDRAVKVPSGVGLIASAETSQEATRPKSEPPTCPNCVGGDGMPLTCKSQGAKQLFTWYVCPNNCGFRMKQPRPDLKEHLERHQPQEPAVRRP